MAATSSSPPCNVSVSSLLIRKPSCTILKVFGLLPPASRSNRKLDRLTVTRSNLAQDFLGDFGARDPYPEEIASQFGDKVLGCQSTEHKILIPNASVLSLSQLECSPVSPSQPPLSADDARTLLHKVCLLSFTIFLVDKKMSLKFSIFTIVLASLLIAMVVESVIIINLQLCLSSSRKIEFLHDGCELDI
uniref:Uncharacterized protein n=1 Tax=Capsella rubella TaxID=81985 RepID=K4FR94_9BRAS|nr:hypothetical protein 34G24.20 [Capsella rubella]